MRPLTGGWRVELPELSPAQIFALAVDIESYPRFLPWCRLARITRRGEGELEVENRFGAGPLLAGFHSTARFEAPDRLEITAKDGPFRSFRLLWRFEPLPPEGCRVIAQYSMELRSPLLHGMAALSLPGLEREVVSRFKGRVRAIYGR